MYGGERLEPILAVAKAIAWTVLDVVRVAASSRVRQTTVEARIASVAGVGMCVRFERFLVLKFFPYDEGDQSKQDEETLKAQTNLPY